jgi:predicted ester cyclase
MDAAASRRVVERFVVEVLGGAQPCSADTLITDATLGHRVESFRSAFPDLQVTTTLVVAQNDLVAMHLTGRGTHGGVFQGCPPTGRTWEATCTAIYRVTDGGIAEGWVNWDLLTVMEQLGCIERAATVSA